MLFVVHQEADRKARQTAKEQANGKGYGKDLCIVTRDVMQMLCLPTVALECPEYCRAQHCLVRYKDPNLQSLQ